MNNLKLTTLRVKNFQGVKDFTLETKGEDIKIGGANATGKTTLNDAFLWLLFGKNSKGKADFALKPLDASGQELHKLETTVEADLIFNKEEIKLTRTFKEKWTKKRREAKASFSGHETVYFVNEVPKKKKDFDVLVSGIINQGIFKLLTNPAEFNSLQWAERRTILFDICGQDPKSLSDLDDKKKEIAAKQRKINSELKEIPARIDENQAAEIVKPDSQIETAFIAETKIAEEKLKDLQTNTALDKKKAELAKIENERWKAKASFEEDQEIRKKPLNKAVMQYEDHILKTKADITTVDNDIARLILRIKDKEGQQKGLRDAWNKENSSTADVENTCPTCDQDLPNAQIQAACEKFNQAKAARLKQLADTGKMVTKEIESTTLEVSDLSVKRADFETSAESFNSQKTKFQQKFDDVNLETCTTPSLDLKKEKLEKEIAELQDDKADDQINAVRMQLEEIESKLTQYYKDCAEWKASVKSKERIEELNQKEKLLSKEYEQLSEQLAGIENSITKKVKLLEKEVNSHFKMATFKLFKQQINSGIEDCCETLYKGIPFNSTLNNGARINIGLDIINTLSKHYESVAPIFIDNAESVNELIETQAQMVSLFVTEDKQLTIMED